MVLLATLTVLKALLGYEISHLLLHALDMVRAIIANQ